MSFIWPVMLIFLLVIPLLIGMYLRLLRRRKQLAERYGRLGLVQSGAGRAIGVRRHIPQMLFFAGLTIILIGLARPQAMVSLPRVEGTVILAFDVSGSMAADDLKPTRMEAAKAVALDFVQRQPPSVQIGVVAFSEGGLAVQAPTNDQEAIRAAIGRITPQRGTSIGQGILASLKAIDAGQAEAPRRFSNLTPTPTPEPVVTGPDGSTVIVLLTDGENTSPPDPFEAAMMAAARGIRIYTVGIGSTAGTTLHVEGFTVHTQLDEATLEAIAQFTGGAYYAAENQQELQEIYDNIRLRLSIRPEAMEVTALFAGAGILLLLIGGFCSLLWFGRVP